MVAVAESCPVCQSTNTGYEFRAGDRQFSRCTDCDLLFTLLSSGGKKKVDPVEAQGVPLESSNSDPVNRPVEECLTRLKKRGLPSGSRIWVTGEGSREFSHCARENGLKLVDQSVDQLRHDPVDACVLFEILGDKGHPVEQLSSVYQVLKPGGLLLLTVPTVDSAQARQQKIRWTEFSSKRMAFFDRHGVSAILVRMGYCNIMTWPEPNGITILCRKETVKTAYPRLSIVLPVYNERVTFEQLIQTVLEKTIDNIDREIIIVESNSNDGSRELVRQYEDHPDVKVIYENAPQGKGHAVRNGLNQASGDVILIQDADLEYDIDDYDALLRPIVAFQKLFVLGSRHKGDWKMREFEDRKILSAVFNSGQLFFTWLINISCGTRLEDPFTMYKVFHRECLYGLQLEGNRFDLDWEIVIKFIRKGLVPLEIPVNYWSRSFSEGKKVRPVLDPIRWIIALFRFRYGKLYGPAVGRISKQ